MEQPLSSQTSRANIQKAIAGSHGDGLSRSGYQRNQSLKRVKVRDDLVIHFKGQERNRPNKLGGEGGDARGFGAEKERAKGENTSGFVGLDWMGKEFG